MEIKSTYSFTFERYQANRFIVACKKLGLNPEKELKKHMDEIIKTAEEKDRTFFIHYTDVNSTTPKGLTLEQNQKFTEGIMAASHGQLSASFACELSKYFRHYAIKVFNSKKLLAENGVKRMCEWIWYEYTTNPEKYPIRNW